MMKIVLTGVMALLLTACASSTKHEVAAGPKSVWCNERYLPEIDKQKEVADKLHLNVAKQGYIYAFIGAYVLQKDNKEGRDHYFRLPERIQQIPELSESDIKSGFEANVFEIYTMSGSLDEVVIAYTGSNDAADWITNFSFTNKEQYEQARSYITRVSAKYPDIKFAVTGYSLGGALASHVTKHPKTKDLVKISWVFNPSPKTWTNSDPDPRIWHASTKKDLLKVARWPIFRVLPGVNYVGAESEQRAEKYYLIKSNPIYAHYRWALARNILHVADLAFYKETGDSTSEPLEILQLSSFTACPTTL